MLVEAGFLDRDTIQQLVSDEEISSIRVGKKVLAAGIISEAFLYLALRTYSLFRQGFLSADQATKALALCKSDNMSLDEVLSKQGWFVPARMQWIWS